MDSSYTTTTTPSDDESGWTLYLQHSSDYYNNVRRKIIPCADVRPQGASFYDYNHNHNHNGDDDEQKVDGDEDEDLSMVSDASSGPPHLDEDAAEAAANLFCYGGGKKRRAQIDSSCVKFGRRRFDRQDFALDDTASSHPILNFIISSKEKGGSDCVENQTSSINSLIDYSSQGFSATHYQVVVDSRKTR